MIGRGARQTVGSIPRSWTPPFHRRATQPVERGAARWLDGMGRPTFWCIREHAHARSTPTVATWQGGRRALPRGPKCRPPLPISFPIRNARPRLAPKPLISFSPPSAYHRSTHPIVGTRQAFRLRVRRTPSYLDMSTPRRLKRGRQTPLDAGGRGGWIGGVAPRKPTSGLGQAARAGAPPGPSSLPAACYPHAPR